MRGFISFITVCCILIPLLSACDAREVDDMAFVLAIGIDKGVTDKWRITVQFPTMQGQTGGGGSMAAGGGQGPQGYSTVTVDSPSFYIGMDMLDTLVPRRISFEHTEYIVMSEELARSGLAGEYLGPIVRFREIRRNTHLLVSRCTAMEFLKANQPLMGTTLSKMMKDMIKESTDTGFIPYVTLNDFYESTKSTYSQPITILASVNNGENLKEKDGNKTDGLNAEEAEGNYYAGDIPKRGGAKLELFGAAVFDGDTMVGELTGEETRLTLMVRGEFRRGRMAVQDPKSPGFVVSLDVRQIGKPEVKVRFEDGNPIIDVRLNLAGDILAVQSRINYESRELKPVIEKKFENYIKTSLDKLMDKCKAMKADVFKFGYKASWRFPTIQEWEDYNWIARFDKAQVNTEVKFVIRRSGTMMRSSPIIGAKGKE